MYIKKGQHVDGINAKGKTGKREEKERKNVL